MNLGKAIKLIRTQKDMSQTDLAEAAEISVSYLSLLERGKRDPNLSTVEQIARGLGVSLVILMFLADDKNEISGIDIELAGQLSVAALKSIKEKR